MRCFFVILMMFSVFFAVKPQTTDDIYQWAADIIESLSDTEDNDFSYMIEDLVRLSQYPININTATRDDLEKIFFLTDIQIENLLFHRYTNGIFYSAYELQSVEGFNRQLIEMIQPLIYFGEISVTPSKHRVRADLFLRTRFTVETPRGYKEINDKPPAFKGDKQYYYSRFEAAPVRNLSLGFVAEKDPGEPMFNDTIKTFDFVSGYISWKPDKIIKQVIVGQYKISGGQGLALQSGMNMGKSGNVTSIRNRNKGFRTALSTNEYSGLSGLLLSLGNKNFSVTPFISIQKRDGRKRRDADGNIYITGLRTDGYHRTANEIETRHNTREEIYGLQARYFAKRFTIEAGHVEYRLQYPLLPDLNYYNNYYFRGRQNGNSWIAFDGTVKNVLLFSEIAFNESLNPAIWAGFLASPANRFNWVVSYRNIPLDFHAPLGAPFAESPNGSGESGIYSGIDIELPYNFSWSAYVDYFKFQWLRYLIKAPTDGYDASMYLTYKPKRGWETMLRFRYKEKGVNLPTAELGYPVGMREQTLLRLQTRFSPESAWSFTTRIDWSRVKIQGKDIPNGFYLGQDIQYQHPDNYFSIILRYGLVDAEDYESRVYVYEPDVLYSFSVPMYYGQGHRIISMIKITPISKLDIWIRYGAWHYTDRTTISSGNNQIDSNVLNELRFQVRVRF